MVGGPRFFVFVDAADGMAEFERYHPMNIWSALEMALR